jgi:3-oxoacyl-[acyl-carrier protein] reductase
VEEFLAAFNQHLVANQILLQAVLPGMRGSGYGRVINVISTSVKEPIKNLGVSNTIRGAVASWSKTLATELGPFGITVNNVLPGYTKRQRLDQILGDRKRRERGKIGCSDRRVCRERGAGSVLARSQRKLPVTRTSPRPRRYLNGVKIPINGGRSQTRGMRAGATGCRHKDSAAVGFSR